MPSSSRTIPPAPVGGELRVPSSSRTQPPAPVGGGGGDPYREVTSLSLVPGDWTVTNPDVNGAPGWTLSEVSGKLRVSNEFVPGSGVNRFGTGTGASNQDGLALIWPTPIFSQSGGFDISNKVLRVYARCSGPTGNGTKNGQGHEFALGVCNNPTPPFDYASNLLNFNVTTLGECQHKGQSSKAGYNGQSPVHWKTNATPKVDSLAFQIGGQASRTTTGYQSTQEGSFIWLYDSSSIQANPSDMDPRIYGSAFQTFQGAGTVTDWDDIYLCILIGHNSGTSMTQGPIINDIEEVGFILQEVEVMT